MFVGIVLKRGHSLFTVRIDTWVHFCVFRVCGFAALARISIDIKAAVISRERSFKFLCDCLQPPMDHFLEPTSFVFSPFVFSLALVVESCQYSMIALRNAGVA